MFYALLLILSIFLFVYNWKRRFLYIISFKLDGPISFPIIGNVPAILKYQLTYQKEDLFPRCVEMLHDFKNTTRIWFGPTLMIFLKNINDVEKLLMSQKLTQKMDVYKLLKSSFGNGLIVSSGTIHRNSQRLILSTFHPDVLETYIQVFQRNGDFLVESFRENVGKGTFDIFTKVNICMVKIVVDTVLDIKMNPEISDELLSTLIRLYDIFYERLFQPWLYPEFIFKLTSLGKEETKRVKYFRGFIRKVIKEKRLELSLTSDDSEYTSNSKRKSTLYYLLKRIKESSYVMSEEQLINDISTIFLASEDTTSTQYSFAVLMLGMYPRIQEKVYDEIENILGQTTTFSIADLNKLEYLEMFLNECVRILPVPFYGRKVTEDFQFENFVAPEGCCVVVNAYEMHRNPIYWEKPNEFYPEHFLPEHVAKRHPMAFIPFSAGPRRCLGRHYSLYLLKTVLISTLRSYKIEADGTLQDLKIVGDILCRIKDGYKIRLKYRD